MSKGQELEDLSASASATKRKKSENSAKCNRSRINSGQEFAHWTDLKDLFKLKTHAEVGTILLDS